MFILNINFPGGVKRSPQNFKVHIQKYDGSTVQMAKDNSYVDGTITDENYSLK